MLPTLVHYAADLVLGLLTVIAFSILARQLGLITWIACLNRRENKHKDKAAEEYWRVHQ
jgi:hypothetical protein